MNIEPSLIEALCSSDADVLEYFILSKKSLCQTGIESVNFPLTSGQQAIWSVCRNEPKSTRYHIPVMFKISRDLDIPHLICTIEKCIKDFPLLCAGISITEQFELNSSCTVKVEMIQLSHASTDLEIKELQEYIYRPFLFDNSPLYRVAIAESNNNRYLVMGFHHLIADARSISLLMNVVSRNYQVAPSDHHLGNGEFNKNIHLVSGHIAWDKAIRTRLNKKADELAQLIGHHPLGNSLPFDTKVKAPLLKKAGNSFFRIKSGLNSKISLYAESKKTTINMVILCAFKWLLSYYCGQKKNIVGIPHHNRSISAFQHSFGFFANTQAHIFEIDYQQSFADFLHHSTQQFFSDLHYADVPLNLLKQSLVQRKQCKPEDNINTLYNFVEFQPLYIDKKNIEPIWCEAKEPKFSISLHVCKHTELDMVFEYCSEQFHNKTIDNIKEKFISILQEVTQERETYFSDIQLATSKNLILSWD